jgi:acid phosphatase type 7
VPAAARPATSIPQLLAAGDIASCSSAGDEATARVLDGLPGTILALGDLAYEEGSEEQFRDCYGPSWGRHRARTRPVLGNHEYGTPGAEAYFAYFGRRANPPNGWYTVRLGTWRVIVLNSNCGQVGGCHRGSPQEQWLRKDLAAHRRAKCTLAYWHHPRFSSGSHGNDTAYTDFWNALYAANADVVLVGHDHNYERFAPQTPAGVLDRRRGIRQFVVGTGGKSLRTFPTVERNSEVRDATTFGVLELTLRPKGYAWRFVPAVGSFTDRGSGRCH